VPASNQKLLLSMALLDRFESNHRVPTKVAARTVAAGAVEGDLWVLGGGDPTLTRAEPSYWGYFSATTLADLARAARAAGLRVVTGRVMGARGYFAHDFDAPGWQSYAPYRYVQLPAALVLNGNYAIRRNPERAVARALRRELRRAGVQVLGGAGAGRPPPALADVASVSSPRLDELLAYVNRTSNNFFAEMLGKLLGAEVFGPPGTIAKGARAIERWARTHGEAVVARDSSGLSYANHISAEALVRLIGAAERQRWGRTLRRALPTGGEGTLRRRLHGFDVRAKTGTLRDGTSSLAGWVRSANGRWVAFAVLGRATQVAEDRIVRILAEARIRRPPKEDC
jgi:serine-type D-Ala-D-Ala carboxypeptidase/endopeptidase (penicillin-binding protein 4)